MHELYFLNDKDLMLFNLLISYAVLFKFKLVSNYTGKYHITENLQRRSLELEYGFQIPSLNLYFDALFFNIAHFSSNLMKQGK